MASVPTFNVRPRTTAARRPRCCPRARGAPRAQTQRKWSAPPPLLPPLDLPHERQLCINQRSKRGRRQRRRRGGAAARACMCMLCRRTGGSPAVCAESLYTPLVVRGGRGAHRKRRAASCCAPISCACVAAASCARCVSATALERWPIRLVDTFSSSARGSDASSLSHSATLAATAAQSEKLPAGLAKYAAALAELAAVARLVERAVVLCLL